MDYQKLFNHMNEEFGLVLLQTEMDTIVNVVNEIQTEELCQSCVAGRSEQFYCVSSDSLVHGKPCKEWCGDKHCKVLCKQ
jgi:hypothetical protein